MRRPTTRVWALAILPMLAGVLVIQRGSAQTKPPAADTPQPERFAATTVNVNPGAGERLSIRVLRWSADADREKLVSVLRDKGEKEFQDALAAVPTLGYIWTSESLGYSLRYTHRVPLPDGGERLILGTDRRLGVWTRGNVWKGTAQGAPDYPFTFLEIRLNRKGTGQGKMSLGAKILVDPDTKGIALESYSAAPLMLRDVRREPTGEYAR